MDCQKIKKLLNFYIDKTLDTATTQQVDEHLKTCSACREEHLKLKKIVSVLNSISVQSVPTPSDFTQNIMAKISRDKIQIQTS